MTDNAREDDGERKREELLLRMWDHSFPGLVAPVPEGKIVNKRNPFLVPGTCWSFRALVRTLQLVSSANPKLLLNSKRKCSSCHVGQAAHTLGRNSTSEMRFTSPVPEMYIATLDYPSSTPQ